ncbi:MAG: tetratricopeptide repeat protein [Thermodesulfobacteriota bacterium]
MSVIFRALKKLKARPESGPEKPGQLRTRREIYTFKRVFFSPVVLIGLALILALAYLGFMYGLASWSEAKPKVRGTAAAPAPPASVPVEEKPSAAGQPLPDWREALALEPGSPPPSDTTAPARASVEPRAAHGASSPRYLPPAGTEPAGTLPPPKPAAAAASSRAGRTAFLPGDSTGPNPAGNIQGARSRTEAAPASTNSPAPPTPADASFFIQAQTSAEGRKASRPAGLKDGQAPFELAALIQSAVSRNDFGQAEKLINQFASALGEENDYVIKLKAFSDLRRGDYDSAAKRLNQVLARNRNDLEAGLNMAILEIKTERYEEAHKRLSRLKEMYPDNARIPELLDKLR